jgi:hypothetical protein
MIKGFDCATPLTSKTASAFAVDGFDFVGRYLVPSGWKALSEAEATLINQAGISIISVYETTADRALGGRTAGINDGYTAAAVAKKVGQPEGSTIYCAVDFDAQPSQIHTVLEYIKGFAEATPKFSTGVYGSYSVVLAAKAAKACTRFWQTYAWSKGKVASGIHIYQFKNDVSVNGIGIDHNTGYEGLGAWNKLKKEEPEMTKEDANKVIAFLSAAYMATNSKDAQAEFRRLANELRKVSGQEVINQ